MPENMHKLSVLPMPHRFHYLPSFLGTYEHLLLVSPSTNIQHPASAPHFRCFQQLFTCFSQRPGLCCLWCYIPNCVLFVLCFFCSQFNFPVHIFSCPWTMSYPLQFLLVCS